MVNQSIEFKIHKAGEKLYKRYRKLIPCFSGECLVSAMCCQEKKANKKAKYLAYRIQIKNLCAKADDILGGLEALPRWEYLIEHHKEKGNISFAKYFEEQVKSIN